MVLADHGPHAHPHGPHHGPPHHGGYGPQIHCRNTTNTVTASVCVPAFEEKVTPITLAVKEVQDADYCYDQIRTVCTITESTNQHELCTYSYAPKTETLPAQVTQVRNDLFSFYFFIKLVYFILHLAKFILVHFDLFEFIFPL